MRMHASFCLSAPIPPSLLSVRSFSRLPFSPLHSPSHFSRIVKLALSRPAGIRWYLSPAAPLLTLQLRKPTNWANQPTDAGRTDGWTRTTETDIL